MDLKPGQTCDRCRAVIDGSYSICYTKDYEVKEIICDGCVNNEVIDEYNKTKHISSKLMLQAVIAKIHLDRDEWNNIRHESGVFFIRNKKSLLEVANAVKEVENLIENFEDKHWLPYIRKYWNDSSNRGHIAEVEDVKVMMWGCAGRVMITADNKDGSVTMIFSDEVQSEKSIKEWGRIRGGLQGFATTRDNALYLMNKLIETDKIEFRDEKDVRMLGL